MGFPLLIKAFIAAVVGGLGSPRGAVLGGFLLAFVVVGLHTLLPEPALVFRDAIVFGVVIALMLFRPQGLWAQAREGVA